MRLEVFPTDAELEAMSVSDHKAFFKSLDERFPTDLEISEMTLDEYHNFQAEFYAPWQRFSCMDGDKEITIGQRWKEQGYTFDEMGARIHPMYQKKPHRPFFDENGKPNRELQ